MNFIILSASILVSMIILSIFVLKAAEKISAALNNVANTINNSEKQIVVNTSSANVVSNQEPNTIEFNKYENNISEALTRMQEKAFEKPVKLQSDVQSFSSATEDDIGDITNELQRMS